MGSETMLRLFALTLLLAAASTASPSPPCPSTPANYCDCGSGVDYKYDCRANNGYFWSTNQDPPMDPCPAKYPKCNTFSPVEPIEASKCNSYDTIKTCKAAGCAWSHYGCLNPSQSLVGGPPPPVTGYVHTVGTDGADKGLCLLITYPGGPASPFWWDQSWHYPKPKWSAGLCDEKKFPTQKDKKVLDGWTSAKNAGYGDVTKTRFNPASTVEAEAAPSPPCPSTP